ncbi:hypothetical protein OIU78_025495 [Salix suchowensis]|nr:hypothetical protein OIU78_025495 [Salix suchowensis]
MHSARDSCIIACGAVAEEKLGRKLENQLTPYTQKIIPSLPPLFSSLNPSALFPSRTPTFLEMATSSEKATGSWADKVKVNDASMRYTLDRLPKQPQGSRLKLPKQLFEENESSWTRCLVGFFPGARPPFHAVRSIATRVCKDQGLEQVMSTSNDFLLFRFRAVDQPQAVLDRGPWIFGGKS